MTGSPWKIRCWSGLATCVVCFLCCPAFAGAPAGDLWIGARYERALNFVGGLQQAAIFADFPLDIGWQPVAGKRSEYFLQLAGGAFVNGSPDARPFMEVGPLIRIRGQAARGWFGEIGTGATLIGGSEFKNNSTLGGSFFFTTHLSLGWHADDWWLACRFQHVSNANLSSPNPGVNMLGIAWGDKF